MILKEKKKNQEIGVYEKEIFEELQKVYKKEKFFKYVDENNYENFIYEKKKNSSECKFVGKNNIQIKDKQNNYSHVVYPNLNAIKAFKNFIGKEINIESICDDDSFFSSKENEKLSFIKKSDNHEYYKNKNGINKISINRQSNKNFITRIEEIKNIIFFIKNSYNNKFIENENKKTNKIEDYCEQILDIFISIENTFNTIINYGEICDENFYDNSKYYKYINKCCKNLHDNENGMKTNKTTIFELVEILKTKKNTEKMNILNYNNILSFQKLVLKNNFEELTQKIDIYESLLSENCLDENTVTMLLSFFFFVNICLNDNIYKRILNYIYLINFKLKKKKEYLENCNNIKTLNMLYSYVQSITNKDQMFYDDFPKFVEITFQLNLNKDVENLLCLYKKLLKCEINMDLITKEANKLNENIANISQNLENINAQILMSYEGFP
ncbi:conserved Plasmodium protein, unknown function [Plasmodium berghei]|uniref:Uncharacterized protein n=2 Tax=Plasmodium berghei TaxID=5821 RepID=A0A509AQE5_PLABA|nr:conserved Plasmodium protein, unknown function [Plasmodium berghei ANKA]CXI76999.1 conserved Plasmodium protein, unknown function [Plasmodium berghei]SCM24990.1 conserved Plasmodium protein, unknown function [Plasmodium berghei]SCN27229.1 conserved Plasmodium protein, unknown function [Plasmodium berghei]SCO61809.1 conserved Plasmodium protein, unknown function [Plasmodium berghei]SCO63654.1 conserved Plasmodium protein, unknown function [Plasmodium berghei]|eukprot:XP_034422865.1 conserved Plasmodium protein, unknown function [Plasmodium berghei ANKA]